MCVSTAVCVREVGGPRAARVSTHSSLLPCRQVFPLFRALGADGLLIEYEDMFPYEGHLRLLRAPHAYRYLPREGGHLGTWVGQVRTSPGGTACLSF